jgi:hypothetical protein
MPLPSNMFVAFQVPPGSIAPMTVAEAESFANYKPNGKYPERFSYLLFPVSTSPFLRQKDGKNFIP